MAGDQQAATIGQACLAPGQTKATFGTGAFILPASGPTRPHSANRLLAPVPVQEGDARSYAHEGSVFVAGRLIQWVCDGGRKAACRERVGSTGRSRGALY